MTMLTIMDGSKELSGLFMFWSSLEGNQVNIWTNPGQFLLSIDNRKASGSRSGLKLDWTDRATTHCWIHFIKLATHPLLNNLNLFIPKRL